MIKAWAKAVFWGATAKGFWTFGAILSAIFNLTPYAALYPRFRFLLPLALFAIGFFVSSCVEYIRLARKLDRITGALSLRHIHTQAGEVMALNAHTIVADIYMDARNQSADGSSLRLHSSTLNVPKASPSYLMFIERNVGSSLAFKPSDLLDLAPKSEIRPIVKAVFTLPESPFPVPVPNDEISGRLEIVDIHDRKHDIGYSAILARNAPIS